MEDIEGCTACPLNPVLENLFDLHLTFFSILIKINQSVFFYLVLVYFTYFMIYCLGNITGFMESVYNYSIVAYCYKLDNNYYNKDSVGSKEKDFSNFIRNKARIHCIGCWDYNY